MSAVLFPCNACKYEETCYSNEISEKGNTRTKIPKKPMAVPAAHIHIGTAVKVSKIVHADSGMESAESMVRKPRKSGQHNVSWDKARIESPLASVATVR